MYGQYGIFSVAHLRTQGMFCNSFLQNKQVNIKLRIKSILWSDMIFFPSTAPSDFSFIIPYISNTTILFFMAYTQQDQRQIRMTAALCKFKRFFMEKYFMYFHYKMCLHFNCRNFIALIYINCMISNPFMTVRRLQVLLSIHICRLHVAWKGLQ